MSVVLAAALFAATPALAADPAPSANGSSTTPFNCDFAPSCEVAPGVYGNLQAPVSSKFNLTLGGFIKLDYAYNSQNYGPNGFISASQAPKQSSQNGQKDQSIFSARQSRFWIKSNGPTLLGAKTSALIEFDFYNSPVATGVASTSSSTESVNATPRLRHGYANLDWGKTQLLFGQTSDNFGLLYGNTVDFNAGNQAGFVNGTRYPQIKLSQQIDLNKQNALKLVLAAELPYQTNFTNTGTSAKAGSTTGDTWGAVPYIVGQALFISKALGTSPGQYGFTQKDFTAGFFGLYGNQHASGQNNDKTIDSWGAGFYTFVPIIHSVDGKGRAGTLTFEGQAVIAANIPTVTATQYVGTTGDLRPAKGFSYAMHLLFYPTQDLSFNTGYGRRQAYNYGDYTKNTNYEKFNQTYFFNVFYDLNAAVRVGVEYQHLDTKYGNVVNNTTAGSNLAGKADYGSTNIARLALYYFF